MQVHDHEVAKRVDERVLTWKGVESKLDYFLSFDSSGDYAQGYKKFLSSASTSRRNIVIFSIAHIACAIFWFARYEILITDRLDSPFQMHKYTKLLLSLDILVVIILVVASVVVSIRVRYRFETDTVIRNALDFISNYQLHVLLVYCISLSTFLSLQAIAVADLQPCHSLIDTHTGHGVCNDCGLCHGIPSHVLLIAFLTPLITRYTMINSGSRLLLLVTWIVSFILIVILISYYDYSSTMALVPLVYIINGIILYQSEKRSREWYLLRVVGRHVLKDILEYEQGNSLSNQLSKELRDIISYTAHDMKSPCTAMQLGLDSMKELTKKSIKTDEEYTFFKEEATQLLHNLNSTLAFMVMTNNRSMDFAKIHRGLKLVPVFDTIDMKSVLEWAVRCVNWQNDDTVKLHPSSTGLSLTGLTEKSWLRDNLLCIVANACKYTADGEDVIVKVNKLGVGGREWIEIRVSDGGDTSEILDMKSFFDPPTQKKRHEVGGRGLGLFCLAQRVSILQGAFGAEERREMIDGKLQKVKGCTLWFRIPFHDNTKQTSRPVNRRTTKNTSTNNNNTSTSTTNNTRRRSTTGAADRADRGGGARRGRVVAQFIQKADPEPIPIKPLQTALVVDDSIPILKMTSLVLERANCKVEKAKNGQLGLEKMKQQVYDLVVMDVQMPIMTGLEATTKLREFEFETRRGRQLIVGVSANSEGIMKSICIEAGMDYFSIKPFTLEDIMAIYTQSQLAKQKF